MAQIQNLQCHAPSCHGALCLAQCQLDSSMPQVPGAGLLHLQSLFTVIETSQLGKAQADSSIHSEDMPPDWFPRYGTPNYSRTLLGPLAIWQKVSPPLASWHHHLYNYLPLMLSKHQIQHICQKSSKNRHVSVFVSKKQVQFPIIQHFEGKQSARCHGCT